MGRTRFRAYQLGEEGSSFSYCHDGHFTLIEARITDQNIDNVYSEIKLYGNNILNTLHITSWDKDHCNPEELKNILENFKPLRIECPGYFSYTETAINSFKIIKNYESGINNVIFHNPQYINSLENATPLERNDIIFWPLEKSLKPNDNSTAMLLRRGHFTVLSLGDLESEFISKKIISNDIIREEVDIMILAHHGADNGFTSNELLDAVKPSVAICTSKYDSQFDHPKDRIRKLLSDRQIPLFTTKTGDVIIENFENDIKQYKVINLKADSSLISSAAKFKAKIY